MPVMTDCDVLPFEGHHAERVAAVCAALGWTSYADSEVVRKAFDAPGVTAFVAVDNMTVIGLAQVIGDGVVQGFLTLLGVVESHRRRGIARALVDATFLASGTQRLDLLSADGAESFYRTFVHKEIPGFRIYPDG